MRRTLALLCAFTAVAAFGKEPRIPREDSSRPLLHMRYIVGVVPVGDATDVYWESMNELVEPVHTVLFRTRIGRDGVPQGATTVVRENDDYSMTTVGSTGSSAIAMWTTNYRLVASRLEGGRLMYPEGKFIAHGMYAGMTCGPAECLVGWTSGSARMFAILNSEADVVSGPFVLPDGWSPSRTLWNERGIFYVRHTSGMVRAALIRRDGTVQYDVPILETVPMELNATPFGVAFDGSHHVLAFLDKEGDGGEIRVVRIAADGTLSGEIKVRNAEPRGYGLSSLSLAWNGETYLLGGSYVIGYPFLVRLDAAFAPTAEQPAAAMRGSYLLRTIGEDFLMGSSANNSASVFVVKADGQTTPPVLWREPGRRRTVR